MPLLPYTKTYVIDETRGIASATPPASLNIASIIVSETGPTERTYLRNQADLIRYFCTGSSISANDNETIQFNGALLTQVPIDVFRVDSSALRFGVGSKGSKLYFDKEYNLLEKVTRAKVVKNNQAPEYYYIQLKEGSTTTTYFVSEPDEEDPTSIPEGVPNENPKRVGNEASIEALFTGINKLGKTLNNTEISAIFSDSIEILGLDGSILSENMYNVSEKTYDGDLIYKIQAVTDGEDAARLMVTIGKTTFYRASDVIDTASFEQAIGLTTFTDTGTLNSSQFLIKMVDYLYQDESCPDPWAEAITVTVPVAVDFQLDDGLKNCFTLDSEEHTLTCANCGRLLTEAERNVKLGGPNEENAIGYNVYTPAALLVAYAESHDITDYTITDGTSGPAYILYNSLTGPEARSNSDTGMTVSNLDPETTLTVLQHETDETNIDYLQEDALFVVVDTTCFYAGQKPEAGVDVSDEVDTFIKVSTKATMPTVEFLDVLYTSLTSVFQVGKAPGNYLIFDGEHTITASDNITVSNVLTVDQTDQDMFNDSFAIVCKFTSSQPLFDFEYTANDDEFQSIDLTYQFKDIVDTIQFSFDGLAVTPMGRSIYYENYNEGDSANPYIHITKLDGDGMFQTFSPDKFGNQILNNPPTDADYQEAVLKYLDEKDKQYDFVTDGGHVSVGLAGACKQVADTRFAIYAPTFPVNAKKVDELKNYAESINLDDFRGVYVVPGHKNTYNGNFLSVMPGALSYIFARINAFNTTSAEFQPVFGSVKGRATAPNLIKNFKEDDAQKLADLSINSIVKDITGTYIRSNFTSQAVNSYLSEEQYAYLTNVVCHECEVYNPTIIAELNDSNTRQKVERELTGILTQRIIAGKNPTVAAFKVVCDDTDRLNTQQVIEARQLIYEVWLQYTPSVAYVKAYTYVKRLGSF